MSCQIVFSDTLSLDLFDYLEEIIKKHINLNIEDNFRIVVENQTALEDLEHYFIRHKNLNRILMGRSLLTLQDFISEAMKEHFPDYQRISSSLERKFLQNCSEYFSEESISEELLVADWTRYRSLKIFYHFDGKINPPLKKILQVEKDYQSFLDSNKLYDSSFALDKLSETTTFLSSKIKNIYFLSFFDIDPFLLRVIEILKQSSADLFLSLPPLEQLIDPYDLKQVQLEVLLNDAKVSHLENTRSPNKVTYINHSSELFSQSELVYTAFHQLHSQEETFIIYSPQGNAFLELCDKFYQYRWIEDRITQNNLTQIPTWMEFLDFILKQNNPEQERRSLANWFLELHLEDFFHQQTHLENEINKSKIHSFLNDLLADEVYLPEREFTWSEFINYLEEEAHLFQAKNPIKACYPLFIRSLRSPGILARKKIFALSAHHYSKYYEPLFGLKELPDHFNNHAQKLTTHNLIKLASEEIIFYDSSYDPSGRTMEQMENHDTSSHLEYNRGFLVPAQSPYQLPELSTQIDTGRILTEDNNVKIAKKILAGDLSTSKVDTFSQCAWKYFAQYILKIEAHEEEDLMISALEKGSLAHSFLEYIYKLIEHRNFFLQEQSALFHFIEEKFQKFLSDRPVTLDYLTQGAKHWHLKNILTLVKRFILQDAQYYKNANYSYWPIEFEYSFQNENRVLLEDDNGQGHGFQGKIDRIDMNPENNSFIVIDYKTGNASEQNQLLNKNRSFQLFLYTLAASQFLPRTADCAASLYFEGKDLKRDKGLIRDEYKKAIGLEKKRNSLKEDAWDEKMTDLKTELLKISKQIKNVEFKMPPYACSSFCSFWEICRYPHKESRNL